MRPEDIADRLELSLGEVKAATAQEKRARERLEQDGRMSTAPDSDTRLG